MSSSKDPGVRAGPARWKQAPTGSQALAYAALAWFKTEFRWDGLVDVELASGAPSWVRSLLVETHGDLGLLPDEWRFLFSHQALQVIAGSADPGPAAEEFVGDAPDLYALLQWIISLPTLRVAYCDEACARPGAGGLLVERIAAGYLLERREVFESIRSKLEVEAVSHPNAVSA